MYVMHTKNTPKLVSSQFICHEQTREQGLSRTYSHSHSKAKCLGINMYDRYTKRITTNHPKQE